MSLRSTAQGVLRGLGLVPEQSRSQPAHGNPSYGTRRTSWLNTLGHTVLLDVGANVGQYARQVRSLGYAGRIVSFEPQKAAFAELERAATHDPQWTAVNVALAASESTLEMNVAGDSECSSLLTMDERHVQAYPKSAYVGTELIRASSLDALRPQFLRPDDKVWLKLDVQGYEMTVLQGARQTLEQVSMVEMELSIVELYAGSVLLAEAIETMKNLGFALVAVEEGFLDTKTHEALQLNGIFGRNGVVRRHETRPA